MEIYLSIHIQLVRRYILAAFELYNKHDGLRQIRFYLSGLQQLNLLDVAWMTSAFEA